MFIVLIGNLAVLTALHYNTVNCLQIFRRRHSSSHRPATLQYYHVPYNIYGTKQFLERRNAPIMLSPANLRALELQAFQHKYQAQIPFQQQFQQLLQQPYNDQMLRRQLTIGNPIRAPLPVRALGKSRRLFTSFLNLRQSQLLTSVLAGPLVCTIWVLSRATKQKHILFVYLEFRCLCLPSRIELLTQRV